MNADAMVLERNEKDGAQARVAKAPSRYFVGIGAQKAGTPWLAEYFYDHPDVFMAPYKEMHFFSAKYLPFHQHRNWLLWIRRRKINLCKYGPNNSVMTAEESRHLQRQFLLTCLRSEGAYKRFLDFGLKNKLVAGEITPTYTDLSARHFDRIASCLPGCKFIFIVRSPVARFISQYRMHRANRSWGQGISIDEAIGHPYYQSRSDYARTLRELERVVDPSRVLLVFYEYLFDPSRSSQEIERICEFLGISFKEGDISSVANAAQGATLQIGDEQRRRIAKAFFDSYEFLNARSGRDLPPAWLAELR